jgi:hypothetical protein
MGWRHPISSGESPVASDLPLAARAPSVARALIHPNAARPPVVECSCANDKQQGDGGAKPAVRNLGRVTVERRPSVEDGEFLVAACNRSVQCACGRPPIWAGPRIDAAANRRLAPCVYEQSECISIWRGGEINMKIARTTAVLATLAIGTLSVAGAAHASTGNQYQPSLPQSTINQWRTYCANRGYPNVEIAFDDVTLDVESVTCFKADGSWLKPLLP